MDITLSYYQDGRLEGIVIVVEAFLIKKGLEVNKNNVSKVLKKLKLDDYTESVISTYFPPTYPYIKYYLKYTNFLEGEEVSTGFIENEYGLVGYFDKNWAEKEAISLCTEFRNVVVQEEIKDK